MRQQMRAMAEDIKKKNEGYKELLEHYKSLPKEVNRSLSCLSVCRVCMLAYSCFGLGLSTPGEF